MRKSFCVILLLGMLSISRSEETETEFPTDCTNIRIPENCPENLREVISLTGNHKGRIYPNYCEACKDKEVTEFYDVGSCQNCPMVDIMAGTIPAKACVITNDNTYIKSDIVMMYFDCQKEGSRYFFVKECPK